MVLRRLLIIGTLAAALGLTLAGSAFATHDPEATGCEWAHECSYFPPEYLPPGWGDKPITTYNPIYLEWHVTGGHGLLAWCQNYGGYWYDGEDGYVYWHSC